MADVRISRRAEHDLGAIADYTIAEFGIEQARAYRDQLEACFQSLCDNPHLGRSAEEIAPRLRRIRQQSHIVFYMPVADDILIVRVLHHSMDYLRHL